MIEIVTITFSPAIDKSTSVEKLIPEKKLSCAAPKYEPGGGGINVARAIHKLGGKALAVYFAGGHAGKAFHELLAKEDVPQLSIHIKDQTRENLVVLETSTNQQFRFGMPGPNISIQELDNGLASLSQIEKISYLVVSGSIPASLHSNVFSSLSKIANQKNAKLVVDTSGDALKQAVSSGAYLIKPNLRELGMLIGKQVETTAEIINAAQEIIQNSKCKIIVVSMADRGAILVTNTLSQHITPPHVKVLSTVGAGDSMLAGLVLSLANGKEITTAFKYAIACGTAATMNSGTELCYLNDVEQLYNQIEN